MHASQALRQPAFNINKHSSHPPSQPYCSEPRMYSGFNKGDGGVVGAISRAAPSEEQEVDEVAPLSSADETLLCRALREDDHGELLECVVAASARLDPSSGRVQWAESDLDRAYHRSVCMGQMASMLRDRDRGAVYGRAIARLVGVYAAAHGPPVVLDVGTGTGLLAMLCAAHGAAHVFAVEMYSAMATLAAHTVEENGLSDRITVLQSRSTDIDQLPAPAHLLVSELLDSALLGESCLLTHSDAIARLMHPSAASLGPLCDRVCPHSARVFATLVQSQELRRSHSVQGLGAGGTSPYRSAGARTCRAGRPLVPEHWEQAERRGALALSEATQVFEVELFHADGADETRHSVVRVPVTRAGTVHGLLLHWELRLLSPSLDPLRELVYSTAPRAQNWQDHWSQVLVALDDVVVHAGDVIEVTGWRGAVGMGFSARKVGAAEEGEEGQGEECCCGWHLLCGPERLLMLNDESRRAQWERVTSAVLASLCALGREAMALDVSDGSLLALMLAGKARALGQPFVKVVSVEEAQFSYLFSNQLAEANELSDQLVVVDGDTDLNDLVGYFSEEEQAEGEGQVLHVDALLSEVFCYQLHAQPTWQAVRFMYQVSATRAHLDSSSIVVPSAAHVMVAAFRLDDLGVSHGDVSSAEGFTHSVFDAYKEAWHEYSFPYKLGGYGKQLRSRPTSVLTLDYCEPAQTLSATKDIPFTTADGEVDCVAIWVDYDLYAGERLENLRDGDFPPYLKIFVRFFPMRTRVTRRSVLRVDAAFTFGDSDVTVSTSIVDAL